MTILGDQDAAILPMSAFGDGAADVSIGVEGVEAHGSCLIGRPERHERVIVARYARLGEGASSIPEFPPIPAGSFQQGTKYWILAFMHVEVFVFGRWHVDVSTGKVFHGCELPRDETAAAEHDKKKGQGLNSDVRHGFSKDRSLLCSVFHWPMHRPLTSLRRQRR